MNLRKLINVLHKLDPEMKFQDKGYNTALMLLASAFVGPNIRRVASITQIPRRQVRTMAKQFRKTGLWKGSKLQASEGWKDSVSFWLDVLVADGMLDRKPALAA